MTTIQTVTRSVLKAGVGFAMFTIVTMPAAAVDDRVRSACTGDYFAYCSQHDPDGPGVRRCMRANAARLSPTCQNALIQSGEASRGDQVASKRVERTR